MSSDTYHEPYEQLTEHTREMHRAIVSLMEELEAIDWYSQRADVSKDAALKAVLIHNRNEEVEHALMTLEWIRRKDPVFDENAKTYLFAEGDITKVEENEKAGEEEGASAKPKGAAKSKILAKTGAKTSSSNSASFGSLGIGSLKED